MYNNENYFYGTGRRKSSVARVRLLPGNGNVTINGRTMDDYFGLETLRMLVRQPLELTGTMGKFDVVVNVQGDEPFITPEQIADLVNCFEDPDVQIATLAKRFEDAEAIFDPNKVKVVCGVTGRALYFSRNPIPYCRGVEQAEWLATTPYFKHVGMYAYRPEVLKQITELPQGVLERAESLEQLRWLENGYTIAVRETSHESIGIDTPADLAEAERMLLS